MKYLAMVSVLVLGLVSAPAVADPADPSVQRLAETEAPVAGEVLILYGHNSGKGIDQRIKHLDKQLQQPPFSMFDSYELVDQSKVPLSKGKTSELTLPQDGSLTLTLTSVAGDATKKRYELKAAVRRGGKDVIPMVTAKASQGKFFFLAGPKYKDGVMVLGFRVVPR